MKTKCCASGNKYCAHCHQLPAVSAVDGVHFSNRSDLCQPTVLLGYKAKKPFPVCSSAIRTVINLTFECVGMWIGLLWLWIGTSGRLFCVK
jgi:hypothetical protein